MGGLIIGEPLSRLLFIDDVVYDTRSRRYYANAQDHILKRPLSFGLLIYYKLWEKFKKEEPVTELEVFHDHRTAKIIATVVFYFAPNSKKGRRVTFNEDEASAPDDLEHLIDSRINELYEAYKEAF